MSSNGLVQHRRNGKLSSCEPCRKRKLACDHEAPCSRCVRRKHANDCFYHPSPMSKKAAQGQGINGTSNSTIVPAGVVASPPPSLPDQANAGPLSSGAGASPTSSRLRDRATETPKGAFFGESSSSAVIEELNSRLGLETPPASNVSDSLFPGDDPDTPFPTAKEMGQSWHVVNRLKDVDVLCGSVDRWLKIADGRVIFRPIYAVWLKELKMVVEDAFATQPEHDALLSLSRMIWRNSRKPIRQSGNMTAHEWALQSTGQNLRWETVGLIFATIGLVTLCLSAWDETFPERHRLGGDKDAIAHTMLELSGECITMSKAFSEVNDLLACLMYERALLCENLRGDTTSESWLRISEVCDVAVLLGMHKEQRADHKTPFFLCELRIRLFGQIYGHDKWVATFLGRPPRVSYRHCSMQLPADLSDDDCCKPETHLAVITGAFKDEWAASGPVHRSTWRRAWDPQIKLREDILEIAIGSNKQDLESRVPQITAELLEIEHNLPPFAKVDALMMLDQICHSIPGKIPGRDVPWRPLDVMMLVVIRMTNLHTRFLLERAVLSRSRQQSSPTLLTHARCMLHLVLRVMSKKDLFRDFQSDFVILVSRYPDPTIHLLTILQAHLVRDPVCGSPCHGAFEKRQVRQLRRRVSKIRSHPTAQRAAPRAIDPARCNWSGQWQFQDVRSRLHSLW